ncbi:hypothetical protein [Bartonella sp. F02]|uniref:hypothetical protein n=1 Tax=Bartonella sp. F02 TaxID=2967262 RepID=UPI0022A9D621|nr:hypothetical protein [Bartonella sp. F02]MCZ2328947.1 hypothetical protein [Bartonella sp. F02]
MFLAIFPPVVSSIRSLTFFAICFPAPFPNSATVPAVTFATFDNILLAELFCLLPNPAALAKGVLLDVPSPFLLLLFLLSTEPRLGVLSLDCADSDAF